MRYAVVIEKANGNYSAYVPDLPGCVATGRTQDEVNANIREAIRFHLDGLREDGLPIPQPEALCDATSRERPCASESVFDTFGSGSEPRP
jgi:predicted RNase H-like HicB family nuclease